MLKLLKYTLLGIILITGYPGEAQKQLKQNKELRLWSDEPPDGPGPLDLEQVSEKGSYKNISKPRLIVHKPKHPNGMAVLVISGGGYAHIEEGNESGPAADWLQSQGVTAFELIYRLPGEGWDTKDAPFEDGIRAMRLIRDMAKKYKIDPNRIGIMGFSAGGHLAGMTATLPDNNLYAPLDGIDKLSARPDFAVLIYPVLTMLPPYNKTHAEKEIIGIDPTLQQQQAYSTELHVDDKTPPTFLAQATDDPVSNVANSRLMYAALLKNKITAQIHLFPSGGHGWGMGMAGSPVAAWPELFKTWAKQNGFWK